MTQKTIQLDKLDSYSDSLERKGDVQVTLKACRVRGYALWIENDGDVRKVIDREGRQIWFRTVDQALDELINIPYLSETFTIERSSW